MTFGVGLKEKGAPLHVGWYVSYDDFIHEDSASSPVILVNGTGADRLYKGYNIGRLRKPSFTFVFEDTKDILLPKKSICYLDGNTLSNATVNGDQTYAITIEPSGNDPLSIIKDITSPDRVIYNGAHMKGWDISTCAAIGDSSCSSGLWGSMSVGLANIGTRDLIATGFTATPLHDLRSGEVSVVPDNSWGSNSKTWWQSNWTSSSSALLIIEGSTDGSGFDALKVAPPAIEIQSAPPCSNFIKK